MALSYVIILLIVLLGAGVFVGLTLIGTGAIALSIFRDLPVIKLLAFELWQSLNSPELVALPMFILMGEILFNTRLSENLFEGLKPWMNRIPGGLIHINVLGCTLFSAVSGSSAATTATVGRMTLKELNTQGYDKSLSIGSLCGAGTLGFLIPPSIILILYGVLAEVSILDLFLAGIIPGLCLAILYMLYIGFKVYRNPKLSPDISNHINWSQRFKSLKLFLPIILLIIAVLGSMYVGFSAPSEAAVIGVLGALFIAGAQGEITKSSIKNTFKGTVKTISMIGLILGGALFLSKVMAYLYLPQILGGYINSLSLAPFQLIILLLIFYVALGTILDGLSLIIMTLPITLPLVVSAGYDPVWFAIFLVISVEMAQITPPVGFNLFVVKNLTGEPISTIAKASFPFFLILGGFALLLALIPEIATYLPAHR